MTLDCAPPRRSWQGFTERACQNVDAKKHTNVGRRVTLKGKHVFGPRAEVMRWRRHADALSFPFRIVGRDGGNEGLGIQMVADKNVKCFLGLGGINTAASCPGAPLYEGRHLAIQASFPLLKVSFGWRPLRQGLGTPGND